ncbi:MAG TPA: hypothetical protein VJ890_26360 [Vineibacter sp.]|nr:hypothetical protein [Vineibacter sp.]
MIVDRLISAARLGAAFWCLIACAAALPSMLAAIAFAGLALAQAPPGSGPLSLGDLFTRPDSVDLKPGAAGKLRDAAAVPVDPRELCPQQAHFKVIVKSGEPMQETLAAARRDVVDAALKNQGVPESQYDVTHAVQGRVDDVQVAYGRMRDRQRPNLHTSSVPPKGTRVKPGDRITVTMVARDHADRMQTGIRSIQLLARSLGVDERVGGATYPPRTDCQGMPEERRLVLTYTVPSDPPPIVRLVAVTEDFVNLSDHDIGEFPTGDWHGTFTYVGVSVAAVKSRASADIALHHDGKGNLRGMMAGQQEILAGSSNTCSWQPGRPHRFRVSLVGVFTEGRSFKVSVEDVIDDTGIKYELNCSGVSIPVALDRAFHPYVWAYKALLGAPSPLGDGEVTADGVRQYRFGSEAGPGPAWTVTLRPSRN